MLLSNVEYVPLRLLRRFVLRESLLLRFGAFVPFYRINRNQVDPSPIVDEYARHLAANNFSPRGKTILEIGVGRTNSSAYEIAAQFIPASVIAFEPFVGLAPFDDARILEKIAERHRCEPVLIREKVRRLETTRSIPDASVDLILSSSVLEHVNDPARLLVELRRMLAPGGVMLHIVDYRDHFFKYPFHFLQFRKATWNRWLNPGDLPIWRLYDNFEQLEANAFTVRVMAETQDPEAFAKIAAYVSVDYRMDDERLKTTTAALWATDSNVK
jgi:SAM-dependent methyltransferase